ncbi:MAG: phosphotransferase [Phycisphaerales bacterium]|nr:phosphotransferase [Phycisphaerales bacterium]
MTEHDGSSAGSLSSSGQRRALRARFTAGEVDAVCEHYRLGPIDRIVELPRGSHRSPKAVIVTDAGEFLLKRRGPGRDNPYRLAFVHDLQAHLAARSFPMPALVRTGAHGQTVVRHQGMLYELFEFVHGSSYHGGLDATQDAGRILGVFHRTAASYQPKSPPPHGSYHGVSGISALLQRIPGAIDRVTSADMPIRPADLAAIARSLRETYHEAMRTVRAAGIDTWARQVVHCDWHPGNMLFREGKVTSVLDFDSARWEPRMIDVANGALQFSITMNGGEVETWPDYIDETRFRRFCRGYSSVEGCRLAVAELQALPSLMTEALIVEAVVPIAATGSFAHMEGGDFLTMVHRKVSWIRRQAGRLVELVAG